MNNTYLVKLISDTNMFDNIIINPLCRDKKIHVRLRDFNQDHFILEGLEDKLAFYISATISFTNKISYEDIDLNNADDYIWNKYISIIHQDSQYCQLLKQLLFKYPEFVDIKIQRKYKKRSEKNSIKKLFGIIPEHVYKQINSYLDMLNINWIDFILNDNLSFEIDYLDKDYYLLKKNNNIYSKYLNKSIKKVKKFSKNIQEEDLWE